MEVKRQTLSLKAVFFGYLLTLGLAFILAFGLYTAIISLCTQSGIILPANYSEELARRAKPMLSSAPEITANMIPYGCKFAVFDKQYKVLKTDLERQELLEAAQYARGTYPQNASQKSYYFLERPDGSCVLQYYIRMRYRSEFFNQHFPSPELIMIVTFAVLYLGIVFITTTIYAKKLKKHLGLVLEATEKIKEQDLDFSIKFSRIKEFNHVLLSISDMKMELKNSLEQQWNLEQTKKEQISALAHDLKTPLTVIQGNADLLSDSTLNTEQQEYIDFIANGTQQIGKYIRTLIEISNSEAVLFQPEEVDCSGFIDTIHHQLEALAKTKGLNVEFVIIDLPKVIMIDQPLLYRAIMNVIANAVDYSPKNGKILFEVKTRDNNISFIATDSGKGFSSQDIKSATQQFYMGDRSRASRIHYGMGLYITESIVKLHGGTLLIANSTVTGGARVTIEISICK